MVIDIITREGQSENVQIVNEAEILFAM